MEYFVWEKVEASYFNEFYHLAFEQGKKSFINDKRQFL